MGYQKTTKEKLVTRSEKKKKDKSLTLTSPPQNILNKTKIYKLK